MRIRFALCAFLLLSTSLPVVAQYKWGRPRPPQAGACFYRDGNFQGDYFCLQPGQDWAAMPRGFNDAISSIRLFGGVQVRVFTDGNFNGESARINHSVDNLTRIPLRSRSGGSWNDCISSLAVNRVDDDWDRRHPDRN
jgi:hypothetical protein